MVSRVLLLLAIGWFCGGRLTGGEPVTFRGTDGNVRASDLYCHQYTLHDPDFCGVQVCVDFDSDGRRELLFASRATGELQMLRAVDGIPVWSRKLEGKQQSVTVYDLDGDGHFEILYSVSGPGRLYLLDDRGKVLRTYESDDHKLGNSAVVLDADGDGLLEGIFGSRSRYLIRLNLQDFTTSARREGWVQCGCYTSALDVDRDGRWDLFAGSGDDHSAKGVLHHLDPVTLNSVWSFATNDNASSADAVLADIDGDGQVEIVKSVDNYKQDDAHDAIYAFETDGTLLWKVSGFSGEDSPNVADLDGDGNVEIVGMTFGGEVYCLAGDGTIRWKRDLRPELDDGQHMYMAPILCDLNGDRNLEILAMTNGQYSPQPNLKPNAMLFALNAEGEVLDSFDLGESRYWGHAFVCNIDADPQLELVISGFGGMDVIETRGFGPQTEHYQRRRSYQRLNVLPWAYEDTYFIYRGDKKNVANRTDNLVLAHGADGYRAEGTFTTERLTPPPNCTFGRLQISADIPPETELTVDILDEKHELILSNVQRDHDLKMDRLVHLRFHFSTSNPKYTPLLDSYSLTFDRIEKQ